MLVDVCWEDCRVLLRDALGSFMEKGGFVELACRIEKSNSEWNAPLGKERYDATRAKRIFVRTELRRRDITWHVVTPRIKLTRYARASSSHEYFV